MLYALKNVTLLIETLILISLNYNHNMRYLQYFIPLIISISFSTNSQIDSISFKIKIINIDNYDGSYYGLRILDDKTYIIGENAIFDQGNNSSNSNRSSYSDIYLLQGDTLQPALLYNADNQQNALISSLKNDGPFTNNRTNTLLFLNNGHTTGDKLGIYLLKKTSSGWKGPIEFPMNSNFYSCLHPFYDEENNRLLFSSNMYTDKFKIFSITYDGINFGEMQMISDTSLNCNDIFPKVYNNSIYFTSDRASHFEGLNIFKTNNDSTEILPAPLNTNFDDFDLTIIDQQNGYFSSNRGTDQKDKVFTYEKYMVSTKNQILKDSIRTETIKEINFAVQVAAMSNKITTKLFSDIDGIQVFKDDHTGLFHYITPKKSSLGQAILLLNKIKESGYNDAFIIAFYGNNRISLSEAKRLEHH